MFPFKSHMDNWIKRFRNASTVNGQESVLVPGDPERITEQDRMKNGLVLLEAVEQDLKGLANKFDIEL